MLKKIDRYLGDLALSIVRFFKPVKRPLPKVVKKILLIKLIAMGDLIIITPLVRTLRQAYPEASIDLLAAPRVRPIVENMSLYRRVHYLSFGLDFILSFINNILVLRREHYDMVIDLEFYYRLTTLMAHVSGPKCIIGFDLQPSRSNVFDVAVPYDADVHVADAYLNIARSLGITDIDTTLEPLRIKDSDSSLVAHQVPFEDFMMVHVGTSARAVSRRWATNNWAA